MNKYIIALFATISITSLTHPSSKFSLDDIIFPPKTMKLIDAAREGDVKKIRKCIRMGGDPTWHKGDPKFNFDTPLTAAVRSNSVYAVQVLLANGSAEIINWVVLNRDYDCSYLSALDLAIKQKNIPIIRALLNRGAEIQGNTYWNNARDSLIFAIESGSLEIVQLLLKHNPSVEENHIATAIKCGHEDITQILLESQVK